jgi:hypothetical protein
MPQEDGLEYGRRPAAAFVHQGVGHGTTRVHPS